MKVWKRIHYVLGLIAGSVLTFWRVSAGSAGMPPVNMNNQGLQPKSRAAQPEPFVQKSHQIIVEDASGVKSKGVIGIRPDGRIHGLINRDVLTAENSRPVLAQTSDEKRSNKLPIPAGEKGITPKTAGEKKVLKPLMYVMNSRDGKNFKGEIVGNKLYFIDGGKKTLAKDGTYFTKTGEKIVVKGGMIVQKGPAVKGKDKFCWEKPSLKLNPSPHSMNMIPGTDEAIHVILTDEENETLVFENRDRVWFRNAERFLECSLSNGRRMIIRDSGLCEVYGAGGQMEKSFYHPRAERMAQAAAITWGMKRQISMIKRRGEA